MMKKTEGASEQKIIFRCELIEITSEQYLRWWKNKSITKSNGVKSRERYFIRRPQQYSRAATAKANDSIICSSYNFHEPPPTPHDDWRWSFIVFISKIAFLSLSRALEERPTGRFVNVIKWWGKLSSQSKNTFCLIAIRQPQTINAADFPSSNIPKRKKNGKSGAVELPSSSTHQNPKPLFYDGQWFIMRFKMCLLPFRPRQKGETSGAHKRGSTAISPIFQTILFIVLLMA